MKPLLLPTAARYAKAVAGGLVSGLIALDAVLDNGITGHEWIRVALATLAGLGVVATVPNKKRQKG